MMHILHAVIAANCAVILVNLIGMASGVGRNMTDRQFGWTIGLLDGGAWIGVVVIGLVALP